MLHKHWDVLENKPCSTNTITQFFNKNYCLTILQNTQCFENKELNFVKQTQLILRDVSDSITKKNPSALIPMLAFINK